MTVGATLEDIRFDERGLIPAVVQHWLDGTVLMVGFMNREALDRTLETRGVHFWSRSRNRLWEKGETSGNRLRLKGLSLDCDQDVILVQAEPQGPTCHTGARTCFFTPLAPDREASSEPGGPAPGHLPVPGHLIDALYQVILERKRSPRESSYVSTLLGGEVDRPLKKVVEEAGEVLLAAKNNSREELVHEAADLLFHLLVVLGAYDLMPEDIYRELEGRMGKSGLRAPQGERSR